MSEVTVLYINYTRGNVWRVYNKTMLTLLSYNIQFGRRLTQIIEWLAAHKHKCEIICFQEFPESKIKQVLDRIGTEWGHAFAPAFTKARIKYGELTLFNNQALTLIKEQIVFLGASRLELLISRHTAHRSGLLTSFRYKNSTILVVNVHLACISQNNLRLKELQLILKYIGDQKKAVIVGDFNYSSWTGRRKLYRFMRTFQFESAGEMITHRLFKLPQQLDYVFARNVAIGEVASQRLPFSDHYPIFAKAVTI